MKKLDATIERFVRNAEYERTHGSLQGCMDFKQLAEWLKDYKRLLKQEPCDDCISRRAAIDELKRISFSYWFECGDYISEDTREIEIINSDKALEVIEALPSVTPAEKTGHWIENAPEYQNIDPPYICSECGNMHLRKTNYCDQCGAKMKEGD